MKTILFQGDSITDARRERDSDHMLGNGYATMAAGELGLNNPGQYRFLNRGIGGNRVMDLYSRWRTDCINLAPDIMSVLVGVNDVWHEYEVQNGIDVEKYKKIYKLMLDETYEQLPDIKIMLMTPFLLKYTSTEHIWEEFYSEVQKRQNAVLEIAEEYRLPCIVLQNEFDLALKAAPVEYWTVDGVHPTAQGHAIIARAWLNCFEANF